MRRFRFGQRPWRNEIGNVHVMHAYQKYRSYDSFRGRYPGDHMIADCFTRVLERV